MSRKARPARAPFPADEAAATLEYEFNSLGDALTEYRKHKPPPGAFATPLSNAAMEAFLLHARNLRSFFRARTDDADNIIAIDWLSTPTAFPMPVLLDTVGSNLDKLLAHPSYTRGQLPKKWPHDAIHAELASNWRKFLDQLAIDNPSLRKLFK